MFLTEKDSQIALMEIAGARTQAQIERLNRLQSDRFKLNQRMKIEVFSLFDYTDFPIFQQERLFFQSEKAVALVTHCELLELDLFEFLSTAQ